MIIKAKPEHLPEMLRLVEGLVQESGYKITFDADYVEAMFKAGMDNPETCLIISVDDGGDVVGGALMEVGRLWTREQWGFVQGFLVEPSRRGSRAAREIVAELVAFASDAGLSHVFTSSTAMVNPKVTRLYVNLFKRFGFNEAGPVLVLGETVHV